MTEGNSEPDMLKPDRSTDWEALARYISGESPADERARLEASLAANPEDRKLLAALENALGTLSGDIRHDIDVEAALARVKARRDSDEKVVPIRPGRSRRAGTAPAATTRWRVPFPAIAAAALLTAGVAGWIGLRDRQSEQAALVQPRMVATGVGVRDSLTLPDGTRIILGPLSSVSVRAGYGADNREVVVSGDAWFDVVHDDSKPFTVWAGAANIVDIGTKFAVRSDTSLGVSVTVTEGAVSLRPSSILASKDVILNAGDNGLLRKDGEVVVGRGSVTDDDLAWMRGRLVFREAPVREVVASIRRWYGIELSVDSSLMSRHITATFDGESASEALEVIRLVLGADIVRRGDSARIGPAAGRTR